MSYKLPKNTQTFLVQLLEQTVKSKPEDTGIKGLDDFTKKYGPKTEKPTSFGGGSGSGMKSKQTKIKKDPTTLEGMYEIGLGDTSYGDALKAAGLYGAGSLGGGVLDYLGMMTGKKFGLSKKDIESGIGPGEYLKKRVGSGAAGLLMGLGDQIRHLTGKSWFDAQVANIGKSQMQLAAQGAGKPWTPFVLPK